ncbi:MAG TPA: hypothetical protein VE690_08870, partial [Rhodopila sp.]|nr:hypothetical protein [Rhodopila sp.]
MKAATEAASPRVLRRSAATFRFSSLRTEQSSPVTAGFWPAASWAGPWLTICLSHLSVAQIQAFRIADNRLIEIATWNDQLLAEALRDPAALGLEFSLEVTGFEMAEIDLRIEELNDSDTPKNDPADQCRAPAGPAISQPGDLWCLGRHRVFCGSALDEAAYR